MTRPTHEGPAGVPEPPADRPPPDDPDRQAVTPGDIGEDRARPTTWLWVAVGIFVVVLVILFIARMGTTPQERAPAPADRTQTPEPALETGAPPTP